MRFSSRFRIKRARTSVFFEFLSLPLLDFNFDTFDYQVLSDYVIRTNDYNFVLILRDFVCMNPFFLTDALR